MNRLIASALAVATLAGAAAPAMAAPWQNINQRQAQLDRRIDQGVRQNDLTRAEAQRLRAEFRQIARLEVRYRSNGLSQWERRDLDRRFDVLSARIKHERHDYQARGSRNDRRG
jgi:opacity protein-like surface antigen